MGGTFKYFWGNRDFFSPHKQLGKVIISQFRNKGKEISFKLSLPDSLSLYSDFIMFLHLSMYFFFPFLPYFFYFLPFFFFFFFFLLPFYSSFFRFFKKLIDEWFPVVCLQNSKPGTFQHLHHQ